MNESSRQPPHFMPNLKIRTGALTPNPPRPFASPPNLSPLLSLTDIPIIATKIGIDSLGSKCRVCSNTHLARAASAIATLATDRHQPGARTSTHCSSTTRSARSLTSSFCSRHRSPPNMDKVTLHRLKCENRSWKAYDRWAMCCAPHLGCAACS